MIDTTITIKPHPRFGCVHYHVEREVTEEEIERVGHMPYDTTWAVYFACSPSLIYCNEDAKVFVVNEHGTCEAYRLDQLFVDHETGELTVDIEKMRELDDETVLRAVQLFRKEHSEDD